MFLYKLDGLPDSVPPTIQRYRLRIALVLMHSIQCPRVKFKAFKY